MKTLKDINFEASYLKSRHDIYEEFYKPCMENSVIYDRVTGYFGSSVFLVINKSIRIFIENGGKVRIICSPVLKEEDINAIYEGYYQKAHIAIVKSLDETIEELNKEFPNTFKLLSKLISLNILEIKLALIDETSSYFRLMHDKAGVFIDEQNNAVGFRGSFNETFKGLSKYGNGESFDAFTSWEGNKDSERVKLVRDQFQKMWINNEPQIRTFEVPSESIEKIKSYSTEATLDELYEEIDAELYLEEKKWFADIESTNKRIVRKHQETALNNWEKNNYQGILEMCTGSGKTFIALCAIRECIFDKNEIPIILVPTKLLHDQWSEEIKKAFGNKVMLLRVGAGHKIDISNLKIFTNPCLPVNKNRRCVIATYSSACKDDFIESVFWGNHIFLICDEVHNIGATGNLKLLSVNTGKKMGLSATPTRYFDSGGTKKIIEFFGGIIQPKYTISDAIRDGVLVEYYYDVSEIPLTIVEQREWNKLTKTINKKIAILKSKDEITCDSSLENLLYQRADIIKKAENKISHAVEILQKNYKDGDRWLIYLDDTDHVNKLKFKLSQHSIFKDNVFEYHSNYDGDLATTLNYFVNCGGILLSINCLDEGVDIPAVDNALILSSSKNPRQYIQRRGRVLRRSQNKIAASIYDCLVSPNNLVHDDVSNLSIINSEIARSLEFSNNAKNKDIVQKKIQIIMIKNGILSDEGEFGINE